MVEWSEKSPIKELEAAEFRVWIAVMRHILRWSRTNARWDGPVTWLCQRLNPMHSYLRVSSIEFCGGNFWAETSDIIIIIINAQNCTIRLLCMSEVLVWLPVIVKNMRRKLSWLKRNALGMDGWNPSFEKAHFAKKLHHGRANCYGLDGRYWQGCSCGNEFNLWDQFNGNLGEGAYACTSDSHQLGLLKKMAYCWLGPV